MFIEHKDNEDIHYFAQNLLSPQIFITETVPSKIPYNQTKFK